MTSLVRDGEDTLWDPTLTTSFGSCLPSPVFSLDWYRVILSKLLRWAPKSVEHIDISPFTLPSGHELPRSVWRVNGQGPDVWPYDFDVEMIAESEARSIRKDAGLVVIGYRKTSRTHELEEWKE